MNVWRGQLFTEFDKDTKLLVMSMLGILQKNYHKSQDEKIAGLRLLEKSKLLSEEVQVRGERAAWIQVARGVEQGSGVVRYKDFEGWK